MRFFQTLQAAVRPDSLQDLRARAQATTSDFARNVGGSARQLAEQVVEPERIDAAMQGARGVGAFLQEREDAVWGQVADVATAATGRAVDPADVKRTGRLIVAGMVCAELVSGLTEGVAWEGGELVGADAGASASAAPAGEVPTVLYDGMGNMDGTTTITDGGVAYDS